MSFFPIDFHKSQNFSLYERNSSPQWSEFFFLASETPDQVLFTPVKISFLAMCGMMCIMYHVWCVVWCSIMCIMCGVLFRSIQLFFTRYCTSVTNIAWTNINDIHHEETNFHHLSCVWDQSWQNAGVGTGLPGN